MQQRDPWNSFKTEEVIKERERGKDVVLLHGNGSNELISSRRLMMRKILTIILIRFVMKKSNTEGNNKKDDMESVHSK